MGRITKEVIESFYFEAKLVYKKLKSKEDALNSLKSLSVNRGSATDYINNLTSMLNGEKYTRTMNEEGTEYYLNQILIDFGKESLVKALSAVDKHLNYYNSLEHGQLIGIRKIHDKFSKIIATFTETTIYPDEILNDEEYIEGTTITKFINAYERDEKARKKCLDFYGYNCSVCDINFEKEYGTIGINYIHVHHLIPLSEIKKEYIVDPIKDLHPVCPNCHAMIHRSNPILKIEELKKIINKGE